MTITVIAWKSNGAWRIGEVAKDTTWEGGAHVNGESLKSIFENCETGVFLLNSWKLTIPEVLEQAL